MLRAEAGSAGRMERLVADKIVTPGAVAPTTTDQGVVRKPVHDAIALRTPMVLLRESHAEPML